MSFGVGFGDLVLASKLAWNVYKACKDSGENFKRLSSEVASLHVVLKETEDYINEFSKLDTSRKNRLNILTDGCNATLEDLQKLLKSYERLGTQSQRTWDRMRFGLEDLADIRSRLVSNATLLTAFNSTLVSSSTTRIEKKLNKFICEVRAGYREGSVVTTPDVVETIESPDVWAQLRRELEDIGISPAIMEEHHEYISNWMKSVLAQGLINEDPVAELNKTVSPDSGYGGSIVSSSADMNIANEQFELEMRKKQAERPLDEVFKPLTVESTAPSVRKKSITDPTRLIRKLFVKDDALVQAASDGDIDKVAKLLSIGCNVNAKDRWGWSALSMCAYGGHLAIARLLLEHGADLYNVDVDGDTPMQIATTRGHSEVVILFDEAQAERDRLARELDAEPTAK
ncbi:hypothetical protein GL218_08380 [Daldinia childiae]|uniref:uncharacterized protein n=1 Tax=Daldinia childiae TaxID=326645 RepID=UPI0014484E68|nr:uncharacterized protein GL218_08380 [Daldinia childiae]KAF3068499.1 hypothetical protein GL218_08380 [Daldinia childiae]